MTRTGAAPAQIEVEADVVSAWQAEINLVSEDIEKCFQSGNIGFANVGWPTSRVILVIRTTTLKIQISKDLRLSGSSQLLVC
jgi:hypothetical protein